jgi:hypothetical protein
MDPKNMTQGQRQTLWEQAGHAGIAPVGYGGEGGGSSSGGGFQPFSAPDVAKLREQVYKTLQPYYLQLAKEAQGDFDRASKILQEDYVKGTRDQRVEFAFTQKQQTDELKNTLTSLGITNLEDQESSIDKLNQRGMAVYQNNADGTPNVVRPSQIVSNTNTNVAPGQAIDSTSTIISPQGNLGRGGYELAQLQQAQKLRQEAQQRSLTKPIEAAGIQLKQYTNLPSGIDPNQSPDQLTKALAAPGVDRSQLGSAEQGLIRGTEQKTRELQQTQEDLSNQRNQDVSQVAGGLASTGTKALGSEMENQLLKERQANFVNTGA